MGKDGLSATLVSTHTHKGSQSALNGGEEICSLPLTALMSLSITNEGWAIAPTLQMPLSDSWRHTKRAPQLFFQSRNSQSAYGSSNPFIEGFFGFFECDSPISDAGEFDTVGFAVQLLDGSDPFLSDLFRSRVVPVFPLCEVKVGIVQGVLRVFADCILSGSALVSYALCQNSLSVSLPGQEDMQASPDQARGCSANLHQENSRHRA